MSESPEPQAPSEPTPGEVAPSAAGPPRQVRWWRRRRWLAGGLAVGGLALLVWSAVTVATWPDVAALAKANPKSTAFIDRYEQRRKEPIARVSARQSAQRQGRPVDVASPLPPLRFRVVPWAAIAPTLKHAVIVAEDIDFFSHQGFATAQIRAALREAWEDGELPRGASTLTQQLAKNLWLTPSYNPLRKVREAVLTWQLERALSKRRILELYLNVVEFGPGVYGADAAARHYFGIPASALDARQAAELAAALPRPSNWHPGVASSGYQRHVERILGRMAKAQWVLKEL